MYRLAETRGIRYRAARTITPYLPIDPAAKTEYIKNHMIDVDGKCDVTSTVPGTKLVGCIQRTPFSRVSHGSQYTSGDFPKWCAGNNTTQYRGEAGVCWTAIMEYLVSWAEAQQEKSSKLMLL